MIKKVTVNNGVFEHSYLEMDWEDFKKYFLKEEEPEEEEDNKVHFLDISEIEIPEDEDNGEESN